MAVDTLGQLIAMTVTSTDEQERAQAKQDAQASESDLQIVKLPEGVCPAAQTQGGRAQFLVAVALSTAQS